MPGSIQKHTLVYTVVLGLILTAFFDLSRIAALGYTCYLIMDIAIHWGVLRYLRTDVQASAWVPAMAILLDLLALVGLCLPGQGAYRPVCHWRGGRHYDLDRGCRADFSEAVARIRAIRPR
ncbi:MAG: hypothetical protein U5K38_03290 [Woeseiaceae bacterium]|nr:hypothetical protein [Woeseiaceae bacterium]